MIEADLEELAQESRLWPWLDDPSAETYVDYPGYDDGHYDDDPPYYCDACDCGLTTEEANGDECPECGHKFTGEV